MVHYHICWSESNLDWQAFNTMEEAQMEAERLVRRGETYKIKIFGQDCPRCQVVSSFKTQTRSKPDPDNSR